MMITLHQKGDSILAIHTGMTPNEVPAFIAWQRCRIEAVFGPQQAPPLRQPPQQTLQVTTPTSITTDMAQIFTLGMQAFTMAGG